jgi:flagellar biogenesis protein FliO
MEGGGLWAVARALIALIGVCALAWVSLTWLARRGFSAQGSAGRLQLLERISLGQRKQLYLVQADSRVFLLAAADSGTPALIAELEAAVPAAPKA